MTKAPNKSYNNNNSHNDKTKKSRENHERRKAALGIDAFVAQKGVTRSIQAFKHRKESKIARKASLLREYQKVMKKEGLEAARGKKRSDYLDTESPPAEISQETSTTANTETTIQSETRKRKAKTNPLAKAVQKATERKAERERERLRIQQELKNRKERLMDRKRSSKLLRQHTRKGQPVMKNVITTLLSKIEKMK